ncbi:MAG: glutamate-1-semialdehyde-2,1-aminomutase [Chloroflexi bacterium]|nr:glutamate-1-semialdehyde-2,1-aminomutase [Chloroflexota bacterium]
MTGPRSQELFEHAGRLFPGAVNSPVRAFRGVGGIPPFVASGHRAELIDVDGKHYVDFVGSWGPLILGHAHPAVVAAISEAAAGGTSFGAPHEREIQLAELIRAAMPSIERLRFVSSGTEATMSALRLARGFTGRTKILKFDGSYHGHSDGLLVAAGSGLLTSGLAASAGVPPSWTTETLSVPYNNLRSVEEAFALHHDAIAAIIVEPVAGNMGVISPAEGFLQGLRKLTSDNGALLVFDEVITGFRVGPGGAQVRYGITPDLTCLGKIIGGGLPVGAYGGRSDVMSLVAPEGPVYQAGTLSGNPVSMAAGIATLHLLSQKDAYQRLDTLGKQLADGLADAARTVETPIQVQRVGSMLTPFFTDAPVADELSAKRSDTDRYASFFHALLADGIYPPPSQFEAWFVSLAHTERDVQQAVAAAERALKK